MAIKFGTKGLAALLLVVEGGRHRRAGSRSFGGVPVHNYRADAEDWMILFREGTSDQDMRRICGGKCELMGHPNKGGVAFVKIHGNEQDVEALVSKHPEVMDMVEPDTTDYMIPELEVDADERSAATPSWGLERTGVPTRASSGSGVHVYVQDTGIRVSHQDFGGRAIPTLDLTTSKNAQECAGDANCAADRQGHGSHCAGTVAGTTFGVASGATLHAVKTLSDQGSGQRSWQFSAMDWVTTSGEKPSVLSMSLGGRGKDSLYTAAVTAATRAGVTVVVAAGNSNADACGFSPAFAEGAITVGATDSSNNRASYSNYGRCLNIMAPGSAITSAHAVDDTGSWTISGTSMACPHVSGAAALLIESGLGSRDEILSSMEATGRVAFIGGLKVNDPDMFLWVGSEEAPAPVPTPAPTQAPAPSCRRRMFCR